MSACAAVSDKGRMARGTMQVERKVVLGERSLEDAWLLLLTFCACALGLCSVPARAWRLRAARVVGRCRFVSGRGNMLRYGSGVCRRQRQQNWAEGVRILAEKRSVGSLAGKCLQNCVADCLWESRGKAVQTSLGPSWANACESFALGSADERRNFENVRFLLEGEGAFVHVYEASSRGDVLRGAVRGSWVLGDRQGVCAGHVVWLREERHVVRVAWRGGGSGVLRQCQARKGTAPWLRFGVGGFGKSKGHGRARSEGGKFVAKKPASCVAGPLAPVARSSEAVEVAAMAEPSRPDIVEPCLASRAGAGGPARARLRGVDDSTSSDEGCRALVSVRERQREIVESGEQEAESLWEDNGIAWAKESGGRRGRLRGVDESSSDGLSVGRPRRRSGRLQQACARALAGVEESKEFQPVHVDGGRCLALMWNRGHGKLQCSHRPRAGSDLCGHHIAYGAPHGKVRGAIPQKKFDAFKMAMLSPKESQQWYARHLMWSYASSMVEEECGVALKSLNEKDEDGRFRVSDHMYEACLAKIQNHLKKNPCEARKYKRGAGVRSRNDREGGGRYGTEREGYNGEGGGQVFAWYSRRVFNNYLKRLGVTEETCTERDCMLALSCTSDELRKYPMVTERLRKYAGPQCFAQLDPRGREYRALANEGQVAGSEAELGDDCSRPGAAGAALVRSDHWLQCCRCQKWRFVAPGCAGELRGESFWHVRETDRDWEAWMAGAGARLAAAAQAAPRGQLEPDAREVSVPSGGGEGQGNVAAMSRRRVRGKSADRVSLGDNVPAVVVRRRRRGKSSDRGSCWAGRSQGELPAGALKRREVDRAAVKGGGDVPALAGSRDYDELGERSASEHERASEDSSVAGSEGHGAEDLDARAVCLAQSSSAGVGSMTSDERKRPRVSETCEGRDGFLGVGGRAGEVRGRHAFDVGRLADRRAADLVGVARKFLCAERGCGGRRRFQISSEEGDALWRAWVHLAASVAGGSEAETAELSRLFGRQLLGIELRAKGAQGGGAGASDSPADAEESVASAFRKFVGLPRLSFECSMLQTAVEDSDGNVTWRDVQCGARVHDGWRGGDPDDFDALWSMRWSAGNFDEGDEGCLLPPSRPADWTCPADMSRSWERGVEDGNCIILGRLERLRVGHGRAENSAALPGVVLGVASRIMTRAYAKGLAVRAGTQAAGEEASSGRRQETSQKPGFRRQDPRGFEPNKDHIVLKASRTCSGQAGALGSEVHLRGFIPSELDVVGMPIALKSGVRLNSHRLVRDGILLSKYRVVPVGKVPVRVAKYDVHLRESGLRAVHAMHAILSRMVRFCCHHCKERFPTFHPAYFPPPAIAKEMEILKHGRDGVAACNVEVAEWDELPPLDPPDGVALCCSGVCLRCQKDMDEQLRGNAGDVIVLLSEENHMDPCFRFPWDDLKDLFDSATMVEAMLVALEHMQVNFVTVSTSGFRKFRRNTLSFPQDIAGFARRQQLFKGYRRGDRVNSARGPGGDRWNADREVRRATVASSEERDKYAVDAGGALIFPARVLDVLPDGRLLVQYDGENVQGYERSEHVSPRLVMPWHPRDVPLSLMLRRNIGRGRGALEGLQVRWWKVALLLQALCACPRNGYGPWRLGGGENEPMHKFYDPKLFHVMSVDEMKLKYAPKVSEGELLPIEKSEGLSVEAQLQGAIEEVGTAEEFIAAGFDVNFVGPGEDCESRGRSRADALGTGRPLGEDSGEGEGAVEAGDAEVYVDQQTFGLWLESGGFRFGGAVQRWWVGLAVCEEGEVGGLKQDDDETPVELFQRMRAEVGGAAQAGCTAGGVGRLGGLVKQGAVSLVALQSWLEQRMGVALGQEGVAPEVVEDDLMHELCIAARLASGFLTEDTGAVREEADKEDVEEEAVRTAEKLVYGWPSKNADPTGAQSMGRFVKAFPLEFPMGIGDLFEERPRRVSVEVWVQHLLRYKTGQFVGGARGQRVLWAMVNQLLLSEARGRGFGIYRNVIRRVGLGLEGGRVLTKRRLREILESEDRARILVGQLSTVGRDVRSTTMQWAYEGKKLESTVKHLSWIPPWVDGRDANGDLPEGRRFIDRELEGKVVVPDEVGLGRHPSLWWTLNCKYNAAYDVHRMHVESGLGDVLLNEMDDSSRHERVAFTSNSADLVAYMIALRTELHMRIVMPEVVPHSASHSFMCMARMETGSGGNPHYHGFCVGTPGPRVMRVVGDLDGDGDVPPATVDSDVRVFLKSIQEEGGSAEWRSGYVLGKEELLAMIRAVVEASGPQDSDGEGCGSGSGASDVQEGEGPIVDAWIVRAQAVADALVRLGEVEELAGEGAMETSELQYRRAGLCDASRSGERENKRRGGKGRKEVPWHERARRLEGQLGTFGVLKSERENEQSQSALEKEFDKFFRNVVSEWNPCYSDGGQWRYKWDEEIGAYDVDVDVLGGLTAEMRARQLVSGAAPDRMNLRSLLDRVFEAADRGGEASVDVQPVRRLVAGLVHRVARHTRHGVDAPTIGVHACARGKEGCAFCRYGFPRERLARGGQRPMVMERGDREGQWQARFPRNDRLCCSYEAHGLLANLGNMDWRPVLNLWAVVQYVTKYATKAPKGSRKVNEVLKDAVDEVCTYVPEGEGADFLRRAIQKFFARCLGERDYHLYEAMQLGMQLPLVIPLMPVISLNTAGARPLKSSFEMKDKGPDEPVHYDSRVDKFNKRLQLVRQQIARGDESVTVEEIQHVSLYEFWWKYNICRGRLRRSARPVCLMVTPCFSADCANVEHACHESYARSAVIAYWRHMSTAERADRIAREMGKIDQKALSLALVGGTRFEEPPCNAAAPREDRYLGVRDLYWQFDVEQGKRGCDDCWGLALMEMMVDPMLRQWVPGWVVEQYERANPFFKEVLTAFHGDERVQRNRVLLKQTKREMVCRHQRHLKKVARKKKRGGESSSEGGGSKSGSGLSDADSAADADRQGEDLAAKLAGAGDEDPNVEAVELLREPRPVAGGPSVGGRVEEETSWRTRTAPELLSAAGAAPQAKDRAGVAGLHGDAVGDQSGRAHGVLFNPKGYAWTQDACNVHWGEEKRLLGLKDAWYGKASVGDGADEVLPEGLDPWQRFAHDIVLDGRHSLKAPLRMMLLGTAGTGKSRTVRSFVGSVRKRVRKDLAGKPGRGRGKELENVDERVRNSCLLAAPTGCASFQLKFGASTVHRVFGIPVGYCGPWKNRGEGRYLRMKARLEQAQLFVLDELSMLGRSMLGKIEFKVRDTLQDAKSRGGEDALLGGRNVVLAGDPKQAPPIGDDPMFREGAYTGKGQNKPAGSDRTPSDAWSTHRLAHMGMSVRNSFEDVVILRQVHRYVEDKPELPAAKRLLYREDAGKFLDVTRGMAECTWSRSEHSWFSSRNRSILQQTPEGRQELRAFDEAPLLMDGRVDRVTGEAGANKINQLRLERLSAETGKPIVVLRAYHDKPKTPAGRAIKPEEMKADDFRGIEDELLMCEGARVLLTQNLWVEAGLMNGAMGVLRGYMWPDGADPHSAKPELRTPLCVFVEFDSVNFGFDESGRVRSFFPEEADASVPCSKRNWVPVFRQRVSSTVEENVWRENYPLTLAWALTHWKAQGMTLDRVRVHLSAKTAAVPGIGFVACTRVRHPWDIVFEEDLPEYEHFMKARKTLVFRERKRFQLRQQARASRTLRRYGYCRADLWSAAERAAAEEMLKGLKVVAQEQAVRVGVGGAVGGPDTWLWGDAEPDYEGLLAAEVARACAGDQERELLYARVADRLLDRTRARCMTEEESVLVGELLAGIEVVGEPGGAWEAELWRHAEALAGTSAERLGRLRGICSMVLARVVAIGRWDGVFVDGVPSEIQPLHMPAVREALGALIPAYLDRNLDKAAKKARDDFGVARGGSVLTMSDWRVSVRAEDALARGQLQEDALEFFILVLEQVRRVLRLPVVIGSKTVGREVGRQEDVGKLSKAMEKWRKVWDASDVRKQEELLLLVAVDDKSLPQDWMCVVVHSCVRGEKLGDAKRLRLRVFDAARRASVASRIARNVDVLVRGVVARLASDEPRVEFGEVPECRVAGQRVLCAFGILMGFVAESAGEPALSQKSVAFVPDVGHVLRAAFGFFRQEVAEQAVRDVVSLLREASGCRGVLRRLAEVPSLARQTGPASVSAVGRGLVGDAGCVRACAGRKDSVVPVLRVASWNIAGGHLSSQAPQRYSLLDQRAAVMGEVLRWCASFRCDVLVLQECEAEGGYEELLESHELGGAVEAVANRGFVHVYVRKGLSYHRLEIAGADPCVAVQVELEGNGSGAQSLCVAGVHLPVGDCAGRRQKIVERVVQAHGVDSGRLLVLGDMNAKDDGEVKSMCCSLKMNEARYHGFSWGVKGNKFYDDLGYGGPGIKKDRAFFGKRLWAEAHLVGQGKRYFDGCEFCLSDHFGLVVHVDVDDAYASGAKQDCVRARARRGQLVAVREESEQREAVEVKAMQQAGRESAEIARRRAADRDKVDFQKGQRRAARQRQSRRAALHEKAFGAAGLFAPGSASEPALSAVVPCAPAEVVIPDLDDVSDASWATVRDVALRGLRNVGNTCYLNSVAQVLMRTPAMLEWAMRHNARGCPHARATCPLCALYQTYLQVRDGSCLAPRCVPVLAQRRSQVAPAFGGYDQHDAVEFFEAFLVKLRQQEIHVNRYGFWGGVQIDRAVATHADRIFGFVRETRRRCSRCAGSVRSWYSCEHVLRLEPKIVEGGPMTIAEMYLQSCAPVEGGELLACPACGVDVVHESQSRIVQMPNVLVVQMKRSLGVRPGVDVEAQLELPGMPPMALVGVLYHDGPTFKSGHYTCLCRGPGGRHWMYDDAKAVRVVEDEVCAIKPKQVYMLVYARRDGSAAWARGGGAENGGGEAGRADVLGARNGSVELAGDSPVKRRLRRKRSACEDVEVISLSPRVGGMNVGLGGVDVLGGLSSAPAQGSSEPGGQSLGVLQQSASVEDGARAVEVERADPSKESAGAGLAGALVDARTPRKRRLVRKSSACEDVDCVSPSRLLMVTPERRARECGVDALAGGGVRAAPSGPEYMGSPASSRRRLRTKMPSSRTDADIEAVAEERGSAVSVAGVAPVGHVTVRQGGGEWRTEGSGEPSVHPGASAVAVARRIPRATRIVSGFGAERVEDQALRDQRMEREALLRAARRRAEGARGRMIGFGGGDLDRSQGGAWQAGRG